MFAWKDWLEYTTKSANRPPACLTHCGLLEKYRSSGIGCGYRPSGKPRSQTLQLYYFPQEQRTIVRRRLRPGSKIGSPGHSSFRGGISLLDRRAPQRKLNRTPTGLGEE